MLINSNVRGWLCLFVVTGVVFAVFGGGSLRYKLASDSGDEGRAAGKTAFCRRAAGP